MIVRLNPQNAQEVAKLHIKVLPNDFLPNLGLGFLTIMHSGVLSQKGVCGFGYKENGKMIGFIIGVQNSEKLFSGVIKNKIFPLTFCLCFQLIKNPFILKKTLETLLYPKKEKGPKSELVVIGVLEKYQGKGVGRKLVEALEKDFRQKSIKKYKVTFYAEKSAKYFYNRLGFKKISQFMLYNKLWYLYGKHLPQIKA